MQLSASWQFNIPPGNGVLKGCMAHSGFRQGWAMVTDRFMPTTSSAKPAALLGMTMKPAVSREQWNVNLSLRRRDDIEVLKAWATPCQ